MTERNQKSKQNKKNRKIVITKNGPYLVMGSLPLQEEIIITDSKDGEPISWGKGKKFPNKENCALCRCGKSNNKPYCDGSHIKTKFDGAEIANREKYIDKAMIVEGPNLDLTDVREFCAIARFCHKDGGTWELTENSDDPESKKTAIREACDCPSGRLVAWDKEGNPIEPNFEPSIGLIEDPEEDASGPLWIKGGVPIESVDGSKYEIRNRVTLCRCGKSKNKPFCDGSHLLKE